jgi:virginiamycin B lyase
MWYATRSLTNVLFMLTTAGEVTEFALPTRANLLDIDGISAGPDGNIWFTETGGVAIGRRSTSGVYTEFPIPPIGNGSARPSGIAAGSADLAAVADELNSRPRQRLAWMKPSEVFGRAVVSTT